MTDAATTDSLAYPRCVSCGAARSGAYCSECGEKQRTVDYSLKRFLKQAIFEITNLDGKFYRSFKLLQTRPGFLSEEFLAGRRKPYLTPIQMFLIANVLYFIAQPYTGWSGYNTSLQSQMHRQYYSEAAAIEEVVEERVEHEDVEFADYEKAFNQKSATYAKSLVFLMVPLFTAVLSVFFWRSRIFLVEHLVLCVHFFAWNLLFMGIVFLTLVTWCKYAFRWLLGLLGDEVALALQGLPQAFKWLVDFAWESSGLILCSVYLYYAIRRFYGQSRWAAWLKSLALGVLFFGVILVYRFILFWVTYFTV